MNVDVSPALLLTTWRKSNRSTGTGSCVEIARTVDVAGVRDSKHPTGGNLAFTPAEWTGFVTAIRSGQLAR